MYNVSWTNFRISSSDTDVGAAVHVTRHVRIGCDDLICRHGVAARNGRASGVHEDDHPVFLGPLDHGSCILRLLHRTETNFTDDLYSFAGHLLEIALGKAFLQDDGSAQDFRTTGPEIGKSLGSENGKSLGSDRVFGTALEMHLAGRDHRGDATVDLALEEAYLMLPRRVVAEHHVTMGIDKPGSDRASCCINDDISLQRFQILNSPNFPNDAVLDKQRIGFQERVLDVAANQATDILDERTRHCSSSIR